MALVGVDFSLGTAGTVTIPAATHGLATAALLVQVWDAQTPRRRIRPGRITVDPTTFAVELTFAQAQSGRVILAGAQPATPTEGHVRRVFAPATTWTVTAGQHGFATADLLVTFYDDQATPQALEPGSVTLDATTRELVATFLQPQGGAVVLVGSASTSAVPHLAQAFGPTTSVTFDGDLVGLMTTHLLLQVWDAQTPRQQVQPGRVSIDPTSHVVTVTFAQSQSGTLVATGVARAGGLAAVVQGTSTTPASVAVLLRRLTAAGVGASATPAVTAVVATQRLLSAQSPGVSTTPAVASQIAHVLTSSAAGLSTTPLVTVAMAGLRQLLASAPGVSVTPAAATTQGRHLSAAVAGVTTTPSFAIVLATLRVLAASVTSASTTPVSAMQQARALTGIVAGLTLTPGVSAAMGGEKLLAATVVGTSATPAAARQTARVVSGTVTGTSLTPAVTVQMTGLVQLLATLTGLSTTPPAARTLLHQLAGTLGSTSSTPAVVASMLRRVQAGLVTNTTTPAALAILGTLRAFQASLAGTSQTPSAPPLLHRGLAGLLVGSTTTPSLAVQTVRRLIADIAASTATPSVLSAQLVRLLASLTASSMAAESAWTMHRVVTSLLAGVSTTTSIPLVTAHALQAQLVGLSSISDPLLIPNSGEVQLQAVVGGSTTTSAAAIMILSRQRLGTVTADGRTAHAPVRREASVAARARQAPVAAVRGRTVPAATHGSQQRGTRVVPDAADATES